MNWKDTLIEHLEDFQQARLQLEVQMLLLDANIDVLQDRLYTLSEIEREQTEQATLDGLDEDGNYPEAKGDES